MRTTRTLTFEGSFYKLCDCLHKSCKVNEEVEIITNCINERKRFGKIKMKFDGTKNIDSYKNTKIKYVLSTETTRSYAAFICDIQSLVTHKHHKHQ